MILNVSANYAVFYVIRNANVYNLKIAYTRLILNYITFVQRCNNKMRNALKYFI